MLRIFAAALAAMLLASSSAPAQDLFYVGTYNGKNSVGIYHFELDRSTGKLTDRGLAGEARHPSFLVISPNRQFLYAVGETGLFEEKKTGSVAAFKIDPKDKKLIPLNKQPSGGTGPCHVSMDKDGKFVFVANYGGGSVSMIPVKSDGSLDGPVNVQQHVGKSVNKGRQNEPHAHSINVDPAGRFAIAADLGTDMLYVYRIDAAKGLVPNDPPGTKIRPGSGPRHFAFHPNGKNAFVINELSLTVTSLAYDAEKGTLKEIETVAALPKDANRSGASSAEVAVHPSGKWVLGSLRGHNSIAVFSFDEAKNKLTLVGNYGDSVKTPRNFVVDPSGNFVLVGNQGSGSITVFRMNQTTGELTRVGDPTPCPTPVCLRFYPSK